MKPFKTISCLKVFLLVVGISAISMNSHTQSEIIEFNSGRWTFVYADTIQHQGRTALKGIAYLEDVEFENGIIEVDIFAYDTTSYPGIVFRKQSAQNYERFYIRPHRESQYPDAMQYTPIFNGVAGWQLYNGDGYTSGVKIPHERWFHCKMEISGKQARLYIDNAEEPALVINDLKHGISKGSIGVFGPNDGTAYFSNFSYTIDNNLAFDPPPVQETPYGTITDWELSQVFRFSEIDVDKTPEQQNLEISWEKVTSEPSGLVDIARHRLRTNREVDWIWAKTIIHSDSEEIRQIDYGYSDIINIFVNGELICSGTSAYRSRDGSFLGIVGLFDAFYAKLKKGENIILFAIGEQFGGWGFMCRDHDAKFQHANLTQLWETKPGLRYPESAVYDRKREILYVTNYYNGRNEFISKVNLDGSIEQLEWVDGLNRPTGMCLYNDRLYMAERSNLVEIDIESGTILNRYPIPEPVFPNDVAVDSSGNIYISDNDGNKIYKFSEGEFEIWLEGGEIQSPNGLLIDKDRLIVGTTDDFSIKAIDLQTKEINKIVTLNEGAIMDGIKPDGKGNLLISDYYGKIYLVTPAGDKTLLLDISASNSFCADFEYIADKEVLIVPGLYDCRLRAYEYKTLE